jgi:uncharacterized protein (DUF1778 family)
MASDLKREVEEAAELLGMTLTSFATEVLAERARQVKREHGMTVLNDRERYAFLHLLSSPPAPSESLVKVMATRVTV